MTWFRADLMKKRAKNYEEMQKMEKDKELYSLSGCGL